MSRKGNLTLLTLAAFLFFGLSITANAASLKLGGGFTTTNPDCTASDGSPCEDFNRVSETLPAWVHTVAVTAYFSTPGSGVCRFRVGLFDVDGGLGTGKYEVLTQVSATSLVPAHIFLALPDPIMIDPLDELFVMGSVFNGDGSCRGEANFGLRVPPAD